MVRKDLHKIPGCEHDHRMGVIAKFLISLLGNIRRRHEHSELSRPEARDQTRLCLDANRRRRCKAFRFEGKVQLD